MSLKRAVSVMNAEVIKNNLTKERERNRQRSAIQQNEIPPRKARLWMYLAENRHKKIEQLGSGICQAVTQVIKSVPNWTMEDLALELYNVYSDSNARPSIRDEIPYLLRIESESKNVVNLFQEKPLIAEGVLLGTIFPAFTLQAKLNIEPRRNRVAESNYDLDTIKSEARSLTNWFRSRRGISSFQANYNEFHRVSSISLYAIQSLRHPENTSITFIDGLTNPTLTTLNLGEYMEKYQRMLVGSSASFTQKAAALQQYMGSDKNVHILIKRINQHYISLKTTKSGGQ